VARPADAAARPARSDLTSEGRWREPESASIAHADKSLHVNEPEHAMPCTFATHVYRSTSAPRRCRHPNRHALPIALILACLPLMSRAADDPRSGQPASIGGYAMPTWQAADAVAECALVFRDGFDRGTLSQPGSDGQPITYTTLGGYTIKVDRTTVTVTDPYGMNTVQHWGDPHENLNGKHIKDWGGMTGWSGERRSVVLGDGAKLTLQAAAWNGVVELASIYDHDRNVQFRNADNVVLHHAVDAGDTSQRDLAQYDGETALFVTDPESRTASYDDIYNETFDTAGDPVQVPITQPLGTTGGCANPNQVNDYFDDANQGHT
jgi:hypothetical protein